MFTFVDTFAKWMTFSVLGAIPSVDKTKLAQVKDVVYNETTPTIVTGAETIYQKVTSWSKYIKWVVLGLLAITGYIFFKTLYNKLNR